MYRLAYVIAAKISRKPAASQQSDNHFKGGKMSEDNEPDVAKVAPFQNAYAAMLAELQRLQDEKRSILGERESERTLIQGQLQQKSTYYQALVSDKCKRVSELQETIKKLECEENQRYRRQIRRHIESSNQKQAENNSLKRQLNSYRTKISALQTELSTLTNIKQDLEVFIVKGISDLRSMHKEMSNCIEETDTEKMVMESKYKQTNEKMGLLTERINELEVRLAASEESFAKMKALFKNAKEECLNQKFQIEELRQQIRTMRFDEQPSVFPQQDDSLLAQEVSSIIELGIILRERECFLKQVADYHQMNVSLIEENSSLKDKLAESERALDDMRSIYVDGHQDESLRRSNPSLFEFLLEKKAQFLHFEQTIEKIETYIQEKDEAITKLIAGFADKNEKCVCGKEAELASLQAEFDGAVKKSDHLQETVSKLRKEMSHYESAVQAYKTEIRELLMAEGKGRKKRGNKKRCLNCYISIEKSESETCLDCKRVFHPNCILEHRCDTYKLDDGLSWINGQE